MPFAFSSYVYSAQPQSRRPLFLAVRGISLFIRLVSIFKKEVRPPMKHIFRTMLLALFAFAFIQPIFAQIAVRVAFGPPALPVYDQPICPGDGFLWTPGYWAYDPDDGYYWVPGTWVEAPEPGFLWTPGWWGWEDGGFLFHEGFWASEIGFYGGINYGFGYFGEGFVGGRWDGGHFFYNRAVLNIDVTNIHNVYNTTVNREVTENHVSYNGGEGGITARPTDREQAVAQRRHIPPVAAQTQHVQAARSNPQMRAETNHGKPTVAATSRPGEFSGSGVVAAKAEGAPYHPAPSHPGAPAAEGNRPEAGASQNANPTHARDLQPHQVQTVPSSGDAKADQKYQKQQQKLVDQQNKEHAKLQQQQEKEDQQATKQNSQKKQQQTEQRHQQQTQQLEQKHTQQQQELQSRQPAPRPVPRPR
jgi:hypothetical protein